MKWVFLIFIGIKVADMVLNIIRIVSLAVFCRKAQ